MTVKLYRVVMEQYGKPLDDLGCNLTLERAERRVELLNKYAGRPGFRALVKPEVAIRDHLRANVN
jgi:hypothetical protein